MRSSISLLVGVSALTLAGAVPAVAHAQSQVPTGAAQNGSTLNGQTATDQTQTDATGRSTADMGDDIVVTGSRIRVPRNVTSLEPSITIGEDYLANRNLTNVADALNEQPGIRGSVTPNGAQAGFGQGVNFINGFGLGSNRTLVLVDGRRFVSSNVPSLFNSGEQGTQVDLNVIPSILIDRIETIQVGGAPIYGSDAIAGVTNLILKDRYKGLTASITSGITEEGDNFRYNASVLGGHDFRGRTRQHHPVLFAR